MTRHLSWFDAAQLLPDERLEREGHAQLVTATAPYRWDGTLVLTSDRIFFLPKIDNALIGGAAFWIRDIVAATVPAFNTISIATAEGEASFTLGGSPFASHSRATGWLHAIEALQPNAGPLEAPGTGRGRTG